MSGRLGTQGCPQVNSWDASHQSQSLWTLWATFPLDFQYGRSDSRLRAMAGGSPGSLKEPITGISRLSA